MNGTVSWSDLFDHHIVEIENDSLDLISPPVDIIEDEVTDEEDE